YPWQATLGFRLTGMQVFDARTGAVRAYDRFYGRSLAPEHVADGLAAFLAAAVPRAPVVAAIRAQLADVRAWFASQTSLRFFSSSLLVVYDGAPPNGAPATVRVRLIDFAHAYAAAEHSADDGCHVGLAALDATLARLET